jgi:hypothetical protein
MTRNPAASSFFRHTSACSNSVNIALMLAAMHERLRATHEVGRGAQTDVVDR